MKRAENQRVKISARSITIKNGDNKTIGVIQNICKFKDMQTNKQMAYFQALRASGVWGSDYMQNVIFHDNKMYYLHDLRPLETYERYFASDPGACENETRKYNERKNMAEKMAQYCAVIPCYIID